jgi:hypothetical protein
MSCKNKLRQFYYYNQLLYYFLSMLNTFENTQSTTSWRQEHERQLELMNHAANLLPLLMLLQLSPLQSEGRACSFCRLQRQRCRVCKLEC